MNAWASPSVPMCRSANPPVGASPRHFPHQLGVLLEREQLRQLIELDLDEPAPAEGSPLTSSGLGDHRLVAFHHGPVDRGVQLADRLRGLDLADDPADATVALTDQAGRRRRRRPASRPRRRRSWTAATVPDTSTHSCSAVYLNALWSATFTSLVERQGDDWMRAPAIHGYTISSGVPARPRQRRHTPSRSDDQASAIVRRT